MSQSQLYIGTQNGVIVCVDGRIGNCISGRFYHSYSKEAGSFSDLGDLLFQMEHLFNELRFPYPSTNERRFIDTGAAALAASAPHAEEKRNKIMKDEQLLGQHGDLGSFIVRVQHRQNSSWQGRITWMEKNQTVYFRSVWEMMKLIENAIDTVSVPEEEEPEPAWQEDREE